MSSHRVVLTRESADNASLWDRLQGLDVEFVDYPCIAIERLPVGAPVRDRLRGGAYRAAIFVSRNGVNALVDEFSIPPPIVVALGTGTQRALETHGWTVTGRPSIALASVLAEELDALVGSASPVVYVRAQVGSRAVPQALRARGQEVDEALAYRTVDPVSAPLRPDERPTLIVFASPSAITHLLAHNPLPQQAVALCIGPTTAQAARAAGFIDVRETIDSEEESFAHEIRRWRAS